MRSTRQLSITLPHEMAELVRGKVESGEYATESEVIRDGLRALERHNRALEAWLKSEAIPALAAMKADPATGRSGEQVRGSLAAAYQSATKAK
jgi:putative addiction module CopG family antidote